MIEEVACERNPGKNGEGRVTGESTPIQKEEGVRIEVLGKEL